MYAELSVAHLEALCVGELLILACHKHCWLLYSMGWGSTVTLSAT
jgi:hypothetical protein